MNVFITGGTGFVGSHVARQLLAAGHSVRLLVRDTHRAEAMYRDLDGPLPALAAGDITQAASVTKAIRGCDAVVHAAAGTPMGKQTVDELFAVNVGGVKNVVNAALAQGVERIVCLSSITAIFNADGARVTPDAEPAPSRLPYGQSKVEAEYYLRGLQAQGKPIAILYPGGVIGPDDPGFSATCMALKHRVENGFRIFGAGGMQHIDVRDLAAFACHLIVEGIHSLAQGTDHGRYLLPGVYLSWTELADTVERVSGCTLKRIPAQGWKLRLIGQMVDIVRRFKAVDTPISAETMRYATLWPHIANTDELDARSLSLRDPAQTFGDTLAWMVAAGHLSAKTCPHVARWPREKVRP